MVINTILFTKFGINTDFFLIRVALSRLLLLNNFSPYSVDISQVLTNYFSPAAILMSTVTNFKFAEPIFQLFLFFPFSFISNPDWSLRYSLPSTKDCLSGRLKLFINLLNWKPNWKIQANNWDRAFFLTWELISLFSRSFCHPILSVSFRIEIYV